MDGNIPQELLRRGDMNKKEEILQYMKEHGSISERDAYRDLHITSLRSRISELRAMGINIDDEYYMDERNGSRYKRYFLREETSNA